MDDSPAISFFENAQKLRIDRSNFTAVQGDLNHFHLGADPHGHIERGFSALSNLISTAALHDAIERFPPPKCHPETRVELLRMIKLWMDDPTPSSDILWMYGPTGVGKTAIAQSVAEWAQTANRIAGAFFFLRGKPHREEARYLFPTLAYQFALNIPGFRAIIDNIMTNDHTIPLKDLGTQLKTLVLQPFQNLSIPPSHKYLVIIDGLDECKTYEAQRAIIKAITSSEGMLDVPLRLLITSRPEAHIRETFNEIAQPIRRIVLDGSFEPDRDIRTFLQDGFSKIAAKARIPQPWPSQSAIEELTAKSSGQFIYAATVLKFIDTELYIPTEQLKIVLKSSPAQSKLFESLDDLYTQILAMCPYRETLLHVLSFILVMHCPQPPEVYEDLLGVPRGYVSQILRGMHSLVKFPDYLEDEKERIRFNQHQEYDQTSGLRLHHTSFSDFLLDPRRAKEYHVDLDEAHNQISRAGFWLSLECIEGLWQTSSKTSSPSPQTWGYLKNHLNVHLSKCASQQRQLIVQRLLNFDVYLSAAKPIGDNSWDLAFDGLHSLVTILVKALICGTDFLTEGFLHAEHSHWTQDVAFESILPFDLNETGDQAFIELALKYCKLLDRFYNDYLSKSNDMSMLMTNYPGLSVWKDPIPVDCLNEIFGVSQNTILADVQRNRKFLYRWQQLFWNSSSNTCDTLDIVGMNPHILSFLSDIRRSGILYQNAETNHTRACQNLIKLISSPRWLQEQNKDDALSCLEKMLKVHLDSLNIVTTKYYPNDHPIISLVNEFGHILDEFSHLENIPHTNVKLLWSASRRILDWVQRQKAKSTAGYNLDNSRSLNEIFVHTTSQIYRKILRMQPYGPGQEMITLYEPFTIAASPRRSTPVLATSDSGGDSALHIGHDAGLHDIGNKRVLLSEDLLALHGVRLSLLEFLTNPNYAGASYVPASEYHTQFAEICLHHCDPLVSDIIGDWKALASYKEWKFHLVRAHPSRKLMEILRTLPAGSWLAEGLPTADKEVKINSIQTIIEWLERWPDSPKDVYDLWKETLSLFKRRVRMLPKKPMKAYRLLR